jgi:hypothetical protein
MKVTFVANARILEYRPGVIYKAELTPLLSGILKRGVHLTLLDPLNLEESNDSTKSNSTSAVSEPTSGSDNGDGATPTSGASTDSGEAAGAEVGRDKKLHRRTPQSDERGTSSGQPTAGNDDSAGKESNSN